MSSPVPAPDPEIIAAALAETTYIAPETPLRRVSLADNRSPINAPGSHHCVVAAIKDGRRRRLAPSPMLAINPIKGAAPRTELARSGLKNDDKLARKLGLASHYYDKYIEPTEDKGTSRDMSHKYKRPPSMTARLECWLLELGVFMAAERRSTSCPGSCSVKRGVGYHASGAEGQLMEDVVVIAGVSPPYTRFYIGLGCGGALTTNFCAAGSSRAMSVPQYLRRLINKKNDRKSEMAHLSRTLAVLLTNSVPSSRGVAEVPRQPCRIFFRWRWPRLSVA
ncbi:hypothetical protein DFH09DRAFT_1076608 [Mycena vulgaris]|nr:hypothetical protein DFH09DRAFT_1076608 [Mycena vulgaris]